MRYSSIKTNKFYRFCILMITIQIFFGIIINAWIWLDNEMTYAKLTKKILVKILPYTFKEYGRDVSRQYYYASPKDLKNYSQDRIWGYVDKHSIIPGESINLMLSSNKWHSINKVINGTIEISRIGYYGKSDRIPVWQSTNITVPYQKVPASGASTGMAWEPIVTDIPTGNWQSGYYAVDFVSSTGRRTSDVAFIIVTNPGFSGDILVKLSTNTYQAYNAWGGHSLYNTQLYSGVKGNVVSFNRPTPPDFYRWEYFLVLWLEKMAKSNNFTIDYATNFDVATNKKFTSNYKLFISSGHDEYMSKKEFDNIYNRIFILGKNTMFLGANMAFWQVRYADINNTDKMSLLGRLMLCYKYGNDPIRFLSNNDHTLQLAIRFRDHARRPETMLMGVGYESWAKDNYNFAYHVEDINFPFFKDTGYKKGDFVGNIIGYEWDNTDPDKDNKRLWDKTLSKIPELPRKSIKVLFSGNPINSYNVQGKAEAVYFNSSAGAKVFSAGTVRWSWGLGKAGFEEEKFKKFNQNLVNYFVNK